MNEEQLAKALGWFSIGLGLAELLAPKQLGKAIGLSDNQRTLQLLGLREIGSGVGILSQERPAGWLWSRVAGDAMDLGLLAAALRSDGTDRRKLTAAIAAVAGVTALDVLASVQLSKSGRETNGASSWVNEDAAPRKASKSGWPVRKSIIFNRPAEEVYAFWRDFQNLPRFMNHLKSVEVFGDGRSHWVAKGPAGTEASWDAEIIEDRPNELISWRSLPGSKVDVAGSVRFQPATGGRGTVVRVNLRYRPPAGAVGVTIAKLFGEAPEKQIWVDVLRAKQLLETGEIARTEGQPAGRKHSTSRRYDDFVRV